jgi:hypothetical protein
MDGGWGLAPALSAPKPKHIAIQIISTLYSGKNHMGGAPVGRPFPKPHPCPEVAGSSPADYTSFNQYVGDTWQPFLGPCVTNPFTTMPRVKNDSSTQLPPICQLRSTTSAYDSSTLAYDLATSSSVRTVQSAHFFYLFDDLNITQYLTHLTTI